MKKYLLPILGFAVFAGLAIPGISRAESILDFNTRIQINPDSSLRVQEAIVYDFEGASRHGIYRDIPVSYSARGGKYTLQLSDFAVDDENGRAVPFSVSAEGIYQRIKIGEAGVLVSGVKTYVISYRAARAMNFFSDHDELYWNATGNEWLVPIKSAEASVELPQNAVASDLSLACFYGNLSSQLNCQRSGFDRNSNSAVFGTSGLGASQGLTIVVGFPKGWVAKPARWQEALNVLADNWILVLPVAVFLAMFHLWRTRGRDPKTSGVIVAEYEAPDGLSAAEAGTLADDKADNKDVTAAIIQLAVKGYLKIRKVKRGVSLFKSDDWQLVRLKTIDESLADFEKELMQRLFSYDEAKVEAGAEINPSSVERSVSLFRLKDKFYKDQENIKNLLYYSLVLKGYYHRAPQDVRNKYLGVGAVVIFLSLLSGEFLGAYNTIAMMISGLPIVVFGLIMPAKTRKGVEARDKVFGLKEYLWVAEADRLKFHNAPGKTPERFEKLLPYAIVLGVEKEWAGQFKDIYQRQPSWYEDGSGGMFNSIIFISALNNFSTAANTNLASSPGNSAAGGGSGFSGGFSGGGFGGGGGGSW